MDALGFMLNDELAPFAACVREGCTRRGGFKGQNGQQAALAAWAEHPGLEINWLSIA